MPFTQKTPKPLIPLHGVPCIEFALLCLSNAGVSEATVNVHAHPDQMRTYLGSGPIQSLRLSVSDETKQLLGSAGGVRQALPILGKGPFFSLNADVLHLAPLEQLAKHHAELKAQHDVLMTLVLASGSALSSLKGEYREIFCNDSTGLIQGLGEKKRNVSFFTGTAVFEPEAFKHLDLGAVSEFVPDVLEPALRAGRVGFFNSDALWLDIGSPELWYQSERKLRTEYAAGRLPGFITKRLSRSDLSLGGRFELGKNQIRLDDTAYEIEDLWNP